MILIKKVTIRINSRNFNYYKNYIDDLKNNQYYEINIQNILPTSHQKIEVKCDICESISLKPYREYMRSFNNEGIYCCSPKCALFKNKETNLNKYGCENPFQSEICKEKIKETNLRKYGVEYVFLSTSVKNKIKEKNIEKYGFENPAKSEIIKGKMKQTCFKKFGSLNYNSSNQAKNKRIQNKLQVPDEFKSEFELYSKKVRNKTNRLRKNLFEKWNGLDYYDNENISKYLNLKWYDKNYPTIDHKISIYYGFMNDIDAEEIGDIENLCITKRHINSSKHVKCF